jgi:hypothetical protein
MIDNGTIKDWRNFSQDDKLDYRIVFQKGNLAPHLKDENIKKFEKMFKLFTVVQPNILNVIDENGKVKYFNTENELIEHYVKWRLTKYTDRKKKLVEILEKKFADNDAIVRFIELVNNGKIKIQNRKKREVKKELKIVGLPEPVLSIEISKLTDEEKAELIKKNEEIKKELEYIRKTETKDMYLDDLKKLKKELADDFVD